MNSIKKKLNNEHGVSILFGLLMFMVASVVSIVIITAASSSIKRSYYTSNSVQENLALDSLALFMKKDINEFEVACTYTYNKKGNTYTFNGCGKDDDSDSSFQNKLVTFTTYLAQDNLANVKGNNFKVEATNLDDVNVSVSNVTKDSDSEYLINFLLESDSKKMYVAFKVSKDNGKDIEGGKKYTYKWEYASSYIKEVS